MEVPWAQAVQVGVVGFSMVFMLLLILGIVIGLTGRIMAKVDARKNVVADQKKGV